MTSQSLGGCSSEKNILLINPEHFNCLHESINNIPTQISNFIKEKYTVFTTNLFLILTHFNGFSPPGGATP